MTYEVREMTNSTDPTNRGILVAVRNTFAEAKKFVEENNNRNGYMNLAIFTK